MGTETKKTESHYSFFPISQFILEKRNPQLESANRLREQHNFYLSSIFGANHLIALDKMIREYADLRAKWLSNIDSLKYLSSDKPEFIEIQKNTLHTVTVLERFLKILDSELEYLHRWIARDAKMQESVLESIWFFFRGAEYSRKAKHTENRIRSEIAKEREFLETQILHMLNIKFDISLENFYKIYPILYKSKNPKAKEYLATSYPFEVLSKEWSIFPGRQTKRELFYRAIVVDKKIEKLLTETTINSENNPKVLFQKLHTLEDKITQELIWNQNKLARLSDFWQAKTKALLVKRHKANQENYALLCKKKMAWYLYFCTKNTISSAEFSFLSKGIPQETLHLLHLVHNHLRNRSYYSKQKESQLQDALNLLEKYAGVSQMDSIKLAIQQQYRKQSRYYNQKDIIDFLNAEENWKESQFLQSEKQLSDMLNVSDAERKNWIESYFALMQSLLEDVVQYGKDHFSSIQKIYRILNCKSQLLYAQDKKKLKNIQECVSLLEKLPKTGGSIFLHLTRLLRSQSNSHKVFLVINRFYISIMKTVPAKILENDPQRIVFINTLYRSLQLLSSQQKQKLSLLSMFKHLAVTHPIIKKILYSKLQEKSDSGAYFFKNLSKHGEKSVQNLSVRYASSL